jgi:molecular chaperone GrpE
VDVNIPINNNDRNGSLGTTENELDGPTGANLPGGHITPPQDADAALDQAQTERTNTGNVEQQQQAGEIGQQTVHQNPTAGDPENGLPTESPVESESSGEPQQVTNSYEDSDNDAKKNSEIDSTEVMEEVPDELAQAKSQLLHLAADFENYKKQATRRETEARERAVRGVLEDLLPVLDNFERAVLAAQNSTDLNSVKVGIEFILQQFEQAMKDHGVEPIASKGQSFDPAKHEAIEQVESEQQPGTIVDDVQRGYIYKGKVLRPSRVRVAK